MIFIQNILSINKLIFWQVLLVIYVLLLLRTLRYIVLEKGRPGRTMAWMLFVVFVPFLGIVLYRLLGKNIRKEKLFYKKYLDNVKLFHQATNPPPSVSSLHLENKSRLVTLITRLSNMNPTQGNHLKVLQNGPATYQSIFDAIEKARRCIHLEYYIFEEGKVMDQLLDLLFKKAASGVIVRIIYDGVGSWELSNNSIAKIRQAGIEIYPFMPVRFGPTANKINYRNHRKLLLIDSSVGFLGGINITDEYLRTGEDGRMWRDTHLKVEGPAVQQLELIFLSDWYFVNDKETIDLPEPLQDFYDPKRGSVMQVISSGPDADHSNIQQEYFSLITSAEHYIYIVTPYFFPGEPILFALKMAALSGVDVRILLPEKHDLKWMKWSVSAYVEELLEAGVRVYFYQKGFIHSKIIVSDDEVVSIGTANLDERSFDNNFEVNAIVYDAGISSELREQFFEDIENSEEQVLEVFRKRPRSEKVKESLIRLFSPLL